MFKPVDDRLDYGRLLTPPAGFKCEFAIGTTYSLDLETLIGVPVALFLSEDMDGNLLDNPIYVLEGLRKSADKMMIFCEGGQIKVPNKANAVFALLEGTVNEVALKNDRSFHPKIWLVKYGNNDGLAFYRFIILSRNLTFDRSWDVALAVDGEVNGKITRKNDPLIDFLGYLQGFTTDAKKKRRLKKVADELFYVHFKLGDKHFTDFTFLPLGIGEGYDRDSTSLFETYHDLLVFSPFLSKKTVQDLNDISLSNAHKTLITRRSEIPKLTTKLLQDMECYCLKELIIDGEEAISESSGALADLQKQDIHKQSKLGILFDFIMTLATGGLWLIWVLIRYLRTH